MIIFDHVDFSYGKGPVLENASFSINADERVAMLGGSGEGKTTILKLILGLLRPDSGRIMIDGEDITSKTENELMDIRMKFSMVFQEGALFDSLNVRENVAFCLREHTNLSDEEIDHKVRELLRVVGVEHAIDLMPDELSGGMHRRVAIARALAACDPEMFLYDEPTSGLDPVNAENICRLITDLSRNEKGFIIVTHKVYDAMMVADRFMFLRNGAIVFDGNRKTLMDSTVPDVKAYMHMCKLQNDMILNSAEDQKIRSGRS